MFAWFQKIAQSPTGIKFLFRCWPVFWFTGIRFHHVSVDLRHVIVKMHMRFYNKNIVGVHFGGSLYAMTDPVFMMMLMANLGKKYRVLDQWGKIDYIKTGKGTVSAEFRLSQADIDEVIENTQNGEKTIKTFFVDVVDGNNDMVAKVEKRVYIRLKQKK